MTCKCAWTGVQEARPGEGAILEVKQWGHLLVFATQQGKIHGWDLRSPRDAWVLSGKPSQVNFMALEVPSWLKLLGQSNGQTHIALIHWKKFACPQAIGVMQNGKLPLLQSTRWPVSLAVATRGATRIMLKAMQGSCV